MIFCGTREMTNTLFQKMRRKRIFCGMLHGEMEQMYRLCLLYTSFIKINMDDEYHHIIQFLISINSLLNKINEYEFSFASYLTSDII